MSLALITLGAGIAGNAFGIPARLFENLSGRRAKDPQVPFQGSFQFQRLTGIVMAAGGTAGMISAIIRML